MGSSKEPYNSCWTSEQSKLTELILAALTAGAANGGLQALAEARLARESGMVEDAPGAHVFPCEDKEHGKVADPGRVEPGKGQLEEGITTVMMQNLPKKIQQSDLISELDWCGYAGLYDFLYMPSSYVDRRRLGYAFVNFLDSKTARRCASEWNRRPRSFNGGEIQMDGVLKVSPARIQGRDANMRKWLTPKMLRVKNPNYRPYCVMGSAPTDSPFPKAKIAYNPAMRAMIDGSEEHWCVICDLPSQDHSLAGQLNGKLCVPKTFDSNGELADTWVLMDSSYQQWLSLKLPVHCLKPLSYQAAPRRDG